MKSRVPISNFPWQDWVKSLDDPLFFYMYACLLCAHVFLSPVKSYSICGASYLIRTWYKLQMFQSMCFIFKVRNCNQCKKLYYDSSTNPMVQDYSTRFKSQFYKWSRSGKVSKILGLSPASEFSSSSSMAKCRVQKRKDWIISWTRFCEFFSKERQNVVTRTFHSWTNSDDLRLILELA